MIVRSTRHTLKKYANTGKQGALNALLAEWRRVMQLLCDDMWLNGYRWTEDGVEHEFNVAKFKFGLPKYLDYNLFDIETWLSARMLNSLTNQLCGKLRAILSKEAKRVAMFDKQAGEGKYNERLWERIEAAVPTKPGLSDAGIEISSKCADFELTPEGHFYGYLRIKSTGGPHIKVPVCRHRHMDRYLDGAWQMCNGYLIDEYGVQLRWQKEPEYREEGIKLGADQGALTTVSLSNGTITPDLVIDAPRKGEPDRKLTINLYGIMCKLARRKKGSKAFRRAVEERKNYVNFAVKRLDTDGVKEIGLEDVVNIRYRRSSGRIMSHWSNPVIRDALMMKCEERGVRVLLQSSAYRSQRCSECGLVRKSSRKGKVFSCPHCGLVIDADINAGRNHEIDLPEIPRCNALSTLSRKDGFFWKPEGLFRVDGSELGVPDSFKSNP
jgi:predicted RNA-binding Zn-ribbon protein involved in translation (DUF1610 family)